MDEMYKKIEMDFHKWGMRELEFFEALTPEGQQIYKIMKYQEEAIYKAIMKEPELEEEEDSEGMGITDISELYREIRDTDDPKDLEKSQKLFVSIHNYLYKNEFEKNKKMLQILLKLRKKYPNIGEYWYEFNQSVDMWRITHEFRSSLHHFRLRESSEKNPTDDSDLDFKMWKILYFFVKEVIELIWIYRNLPPKK